MSRTTRTGRRRPGPEARPPRPRDTATPAAGSASHRRPRPQRGAGAGALRLVGGTVAVFLLALMLVTTIEVVIDRPLSGGDPGGTTLGAVLRPEP